MTWCLVTLLCLSVLLPPPTFQHPVNSGVTFRQTLGLSKKIFRDVRSLFLQYKQEQLKDPQFADNNIRLTSLPSSSMSYTLWLTMTDTKLITTCVHDLNVYWIHLNAKRMQILDEDKQSKLTAAIWDVQMSMKDLIVQLSMKLESMNVPVPQPSDDVLNNLVNTQYTWHNKLQGYIILRDLEMYMGKVVRDLSLLKNNNKE